METERPRRLVCFAAFSLRSVAHAEAGQVAVAEGEEEHEGDEEAVVMEEDGQMEAGLNVAQHEERYENNASQDGRRQHPAVFTWLHKHLVRSDRPPLSDRKSAANQKLTHMQTAVRLRPVQSLRLKSRKQLTGTK